MGRVVVDVSPSVDGYVAGRDVSVAEPFGDAGMRLYRWMGLDGTTPTVTDQAAAERRFATAGAVVLGRRMFDVGIGPWGEDGAFGMPCFVVTHRAGEQVVRGPTTFTFVTDGVDRAVSLARASAGDEDVVIVGGADVVQQCLGAGLVDEIRLHVVPVLLGDGTRLFGGTLEHSLELERIDEVQSSAATHVAFEVASRTQSQQTQEVRGH